MREVATKKNSLRKINPNASKNSVINASLSHEKCYPGFIEGIRFEGFRHIKDLTILGRLNPMVKRHKESHRPILGAEA